MSLKTLIMQFTVNSENREHHTCSQTFRILFPALHQPVSINEDFSTNSTYREDPHHQKNQMTT